MFANAKKILIETESTETVVVRIVRNPGATRSCQACGRESDMHDLDTAVSLTGDIARDLIREIELGLIQTAQASVGTLIIFINAIKGQQQKIERQQKQIEELQALVGETDRRAEICREFNR